MGAVLDVCFINTPPRSPELSLGAPLQRGFFSRAGARRPRKALAKDLRNGHLAAQARVHLPRHYRSDGTCVIWLVEIPRPQGLCKGETTCMAVFCDNSAEALSPLYPVCV